MKARLGQILAVAALSVGLAAIVWSAVGSKPPPDFSGTICSAAKN